MLGILFKYLFIIVLKYINIIFITDVTGFNIYFVFMKTFTVLWRSRRIIKNDFTFSKVNQDNIHCHRII